MSRKIINTPDAPAPVGPYNQAVLVNDTLYMSGQIAINPATGAMVLDDIEIETTQVLDNMMAVLKAADMSSDNVVKCTVFVMDMDMFSRINAIYAKYFNEENAPARELVQVAVLPKAANIEISCIAVK
jgi:2-iminobutanoate/2-iminopropanoate deaminase